MGLEILKALSENDQLTAEAIYHALPAEAQAIFVKALRDLADGFENL